MAIVCKSAAEIERMRQSGRIVRQVLDYVRTLVAPGVTTMDLERAGSIHESFTAIETPRFSIPITQLELSMACKA